VRAQDDFPMEALRVRQASTGRWAGTPTRFTRGDYAVKALLGAHLFQYWKLDQPFNATQRQPWGTRPPSEYGGPNSGYGGNNRGGYGASNGGGYNGGGFNGGGYNGGGYNGSGSNAGGAYVVPQYDGGGGCCAIA
jgi:hypothetical protein